MSQLAKVPLVVVLTIAYSIMFTPPHPSPPKHEFISTSKIDWISGVVGRDFQLKTSRTGQMLLAAVEVATLLANTNPTSPISQAILSVLIFNGGDANKIQMNSINTIAAALWLIGCLMRMSTYKELGRFFRYDISIQKNHELVTTGLYAYVRHPSYTGMAMGVLGWIMWYSARGSWVRESGLWSTTAGKTCFLAFFTCFVITGPVVTLSRMANEDRALREKFGKKWEDWVEKVPYSVIPGIY